MFIEQIVSIPREFGDTNYLIDEMNLPVALLTQG